VPILTNLEANEEFIDKAAKGAKRVTILIVVDTSLQNTFGSTASSLAQAQLVAERIKTALGKKRKSSELLVEWGSLENTIDRIAKLKGINKIVLVKQKGRAFKRLVRTLSKRTAYKLETIEVHEL
jgi:hypothetical protein